MHRKAKYSMNNFEFHMKIKYISLFFLEGSSFSHVKIQEENMINYEK